MKEILFVVKSYSGVDIQKAGVYKHSEHQDFQILMIGYSIDGEPAKVVDIVHGEKMPTEVLTALFDPNVVKYGWDGQYERVCLSRFIGLANNKFLPPDQWRSLKVWAAGTGHPRKLSRCLEETGYVAYSWDQAERYTRRFCMGASKDCYLGILKENTPYTKEWSAFKSLIYSEVSALLYLSITLCGNRQSKEEQINYSIDQQINDRGVHVNSDLIVMGILCQAQYQKEHAARFQALTGLSYPTDPTGFKEWLKDKGFNVESLSSDSVRRLKKSAYGQVNEALKLWQMLTKTTPRKYNGLLNGICADNRIRGLFQMNGGRAGRYSGTFVQLDNLPNCRLMELDRMREAVLHGDRVYMETCHETIPELLGELLPTVFVPTPGNSMALVELTGIEDKVIDWLIHSEYQAIDKEEFHGLHDVNDPRFCALCADVDAAVHLCLGNKRYITEYGLAFEYSDWLDQLLITLPSGRQLHYAQPRLKKVCDNHVEVITFTEYDRDGLARIREMDGDGFVRDVIRGIVRDLLFAGLSKLESAGIQVVMHFHNSVLIDSTSEMQLFKACELMSSLPAWAKGMRPSFHAYYCHDYYEKTTQVIR